MDPNTTLTQLRSLLSGNCMVQPQQPTKWIYRAEELFQALDQWLSNGGFLPDEWISQRSRVRGTPE